MRKANTGGSAFDILPDADYGCGVPIRSWEVDEARLRDPRRTAAVRATRLLDAPREPAFDRFTREASSRLEAPISLVTLVDATRQFFASAHGWTGPRETPLAQSLCKHAVSRDDLVLIEDVRDHAELQPAADLGVRSYAGAPLRTPDGHVVGALCVIDTQPRGWTPDQVEVLTTMAAEVAAEMQRS